LTSAISNPSPFIREGAKPPIAATTRLDRSSRSRSSTTSTKHGRKVVRSYHNENHVGDTTVRPAQGRIVSQVPTWPTTIDEIMSSFEFALGAADVRSRRGYRSAYATWNSNRQWNYERGRQWATQAPRSVALKRDGKLTAKAKRWFTDEIL